MTVVLLSYVKVELCIIIPLLLASSPYIHVLLIMSEDSFVMWVL